MTQVNDISALFLSHYRGHVLINMYLHVKTHTQHDHMDVSNYSLAGYVAHSTEVNLGLVLEALSKFTLQEVVGPGRKMLVVCR